MFRKTALTLVFLAITVSAAVSANAQGLKYESKGKRDPFVPLIGSGKIITSGLDDILSIEDVSLEGIAVGAGGKRVALINGQILKEDDKRGNLKIKHITATKVTLSIDDKLYNLSLPEEGGGTHSEK